MQSVRLLIVAVALVIGQTAALSYARAAEINLVDGVTVLAATDVRLTAVVGGDITAGAYVASAPVGLRCGGAAHEYTTRENRQCWLWVRRNSEVLLTAQAEGRYGVDWTIQWVGCEPLANGTVCALKSAVETQVAAVFTRLTPP